MFVFDNFIENSIPFICFLIVALLRSKTMGIMLGIILGISLLGNTVFADQPNYTYAFAFVFWGVIGFGLGWWGRRAIGNRRVKS